MQIKNEKLRNLTCVFANFVVPLHKISQNYGKARTSQVNCNLV